MSPSRPVRRLASTLVFLLFALALGAAGLSAGCGGGPGSAAGGGDDAAKKAETVAFDDGPVDAEDAAAGKALFSAKGCSACHAFGKRVTGPDLAGVSKRRSKEWLASMIQHPDEMTKTDPTARELLGTYAVQMPKLNLTEDEAEAIVEYFKTQDAPAGAK